MREKFTRRLLGGMLALLMALTAVMPPGMTLQAAEEQDIAEKAVHYGTIAEGCEGEQVPPDPDEEGGEPEETAPEDIRYRTHKGVTGELEDGSEPYVYYRLDYENDPEGEIYITESDCQYITGYCVPATIDGRPVVGFDGRAFGDYSSGYLKGDDWYAQFPLETLTFEEGSHVRTLGYHTFASSQLTEVVLPDSLVDISGNPFRGCRYLASVTWPENENFTSAGGFSDCPKLSPDVVKNLPESVTEILEDGFSYCGFETLEIPGTVKRIGKNAFRYCFYMESLVLNEGVEYLGEGSFSYCTKLKGLDVILPVSVSEMGKDAFHTLQYSIQGGEYSAFYSTPNLIILNPDIKLYREDGIRYWDDEKGEYSEEFSLYTALPYGGKVSGYEKNTAGEDSDLKLASELINIAVEAGYLKNQEDETAPLVTFEWMKEPCRVRGSVPAGATVTVSQPDYGKNKSGQITEISAEVLEDGSFSVDCDTYKYTEVCISLEGYYDVLLSRAAKDMSATWEIGTVTREDMEEIPTSGRMQMSFVKKAENADTCESIRDLSLLNIALTAGTEILEEGTDYRFTHNELILDMESGKITKDTEITMTVTPDRSLKAGMASATATPKDGEFLIELPSWGNAAITTSTTYAGDNLVMIFEGDTCVESGYAEIAPLLTEEDGNTVSVYTTAQLEAGTYTVVAMNATDMKFSFTTLTGLEALGLKEGTDYAKSGFTVSDAKTTEVLVDVPLADMNQQAESQGVIERGIRISSVNTVADKEMNAVIRYTFDSGKSGAVLKVFLPEDLTDISYGDANSGLGDSLPELQDGEGCKILDIQLDKQLSNEYTINFKAMETGTYTISAAIVLDGGKVTVPISSKSFTVSGIVLEIPNTMVNEEGGEAVIYATPYSDVSLSVNGGEPVTGFPKANGKLELHFDIPADTLAMEEIPVTAVSSAGSVTKNVTFVPFEMPQIWNFAIVNRGESHTFIREGASERASFTSQYHFPEEKNAYWSFDLTLKSKKEPEETFDLYVAALDDTVYTIPMKRISSEGDLYRYAGEYVDQAYLEILAEYNAKGLHYTGTPEGDVPIGTGEGMFLPQEIALANEVILDGIIIDEETAADYSEEYAEKEAESRDEIAEEYQEELEEQKAKEKEKVQEFRNIIYDYYYAEYPEFVEEIDVLLEDTEDFYTNKDHGIEDFIFNYDTGFGEEDTEEEDYYGSVAHEDWLDELFDAEGDEEASGDEEVKEAGQKMTDALVKLENYARTEADDYGKSLGVGKLTQYDSWAEVLTAALKTTGVEYLESESSQTAPVPAGSSMTASVNGDPVQYEMQERQSDTGEGTIPVGFTENPLVSSGNTYNVNTTFVDDALKNWSQAKFNNTRDAVLTTWTEMVEVLKTPAGQKLFKSICKDTLKRQQFLKYLRKAKGFSSTANIFGTAGGKVTIKWLNTGAGVTSFYAVYSTAKNLQESGEKYVDLTKQVEELKGEIENLDLLYEYYKRPRKCLALNGKCLPAIRRERRLAEYYLELLESQKSHTATDMVASAVVTSVGTVTKGWGSVAATGAGALYDVGSNWINMERAPKLQSAYSHYMAASEYRKQVCLYEPVCDPDDPDNPVPKGIKGNGYWFDPLSRSYRRYRFAHLIDPSGNVYEAVEGNTLAGVTAAIYRADDENGTNAALWNAEDYEQVNPQNTDEEGKFAWDTPKGWYQVRFTKEGYEDTCTQWLPVPPPQTGLFIPMISKSAPQVSAARAYKDYMEIVFDQYMQTGTETISGIKGAVTEWVNSENSPDGTELSRVLRIRSTDSFKIGDRVSLKISGAKNYAGKVLATDSRTLTVEARPAEIALNYAKAIAIKSGDTIELYAYVKDADGSLMAGRTVSISLDNQTVAELKQSSAVTDSNGRAKFTLTGVLPGLAALKASVEDSTLEMDIPLRVTLVQERPERPTAQVGAYTFGSDAPKENSITVEAGTMLTITAEEGTVIYYTTDDTCPCQEGTRKEYTGAIPIPEGTTRFRIAAYKEGMAYSEYSERLNLNITGTKKVNQDITAPKEDKPASVTLPKTEIKKAKQPMKVTVKKKTVKKAKLKKKKLTVKAITVKKAQGTVTFQKVKKGSSKKLAVNKKTGKITIKKGTQKGTYKMKVKITAKGNDRYLSGSKTVTVTVKVK